MQRHEIPTHLDVEDRAFLGLIGILALVQSDVVNNGDIRWLLPIPWVFAGVAGLLATTLTARNRHANRQTGWVGNDEATGDTEE